MKVMVGGTFDPLHDGHKRLLTRSFDLAGPKGMVTIGLTTDPFASVKQHPVRPFLERKANLVRFIEERGYETPWQIEALSDRFGTALEADFDAIVVSERRSLSQPRSTACGRTGVPGKSISIRSPVLAEDGRWISIARIYREKSMPTAILSAIVRKPKIQINGR